MVDFIVFTALDKEFSHVAEVFDATPLPREPDDPAQYHATKVPTDSGSEYDVRLFSVGKMGPAPSAAALSRAILRWRPRYVIMTGIAAIVPGEAEPLHVTGADGVPRIEERDRQIGDIVVAREIVDVAERKVAPANVDIRQKVTPCDDPLVAAAEAFARAGRWAARTHVGPVISGTEVVKSAEARDALLEAAAPKAIGIEMEGGGLATAVRDTPRDGRPGLALIKAGVDWGDVRKDDEVQPRGARDAATFVYEFLTSGPIAKAADNEAALPLVWNIPRPSATFTGRVDALQRLAARLGQAGTAAVVQTVRGMGGIGKTQLALRYAWDHAAEYDVAWFVASERPEAIELQYEALASELGVADPADAAASAANARAWLRRNRRWLLIFDNAPTLADIAPHLPSSPGGHMIITSRSRDWGGPEAEIALDVFESQEAHEFLRRRTGSSDDEAIAALAEALGYLPLALEQAGAYIVSTGGSPAEYLAEFQLRGTALLKEGQPQGHEDTVFVTFDLAIEAATERFTPAADLAGFCAMLAPEGIPLDLLDHLSHDVAGGLRMAAEQRLRAVEALLAVAVLDRQGGHLSMHRLVQEVVTYRLDAGTQRRLLDAALGALWAALPADATDPGAWPRYAELMPHVAAATGRPEAEGAAPKLVAKLCGETGIVHDQLGEYDTARDLQQRALTIEEAVYGSDHPQVAKTVGKLGIVHQRLGEYDTARDLHQRALTINQAAYGPHHPQVATTLGNLGIVHEQLGEYETARDLQQRALTIEEALYGSDHPEVARTLGNLGNVHQRLGEYDTARDLYQRALTIKEGAYGPDHPEVATTVGNLGIVHQQLGEYDTARDFQQRALTIKETAYGPDHPSVAISLANLGSVHQLLDHHDAACEMLERASRIFHRHLGPDHPHTQFARSKLDEWGCPAPPAEP